MRNHLSNLYIGRVLSAVLGDMTCLVLAAWLTWVVLNPPFPGHFFALAVALGCVASFVALYYVGSYRLTTLGSGRGTLECVLACMGMAFVAALLVYFLVPTPPRAIELLAHTAALTFPLLLLHRWAFRTLSARPRLGQRVLVIGTSDLGLAIARAVNERRALGTELVGFLSDEITHQRAMIEGIPVLGKVHEIDKIADREGIGQIVVASKSRSEYFPADELLAAKLRGLRVDSGVSFFERVTGRIYMRDLRPSYLIFADGFRMTAISEAAKRTVDTMVASAGLLLAAPVLATCALAIRLDSRGPILYRQDRIGLYGKPFRVIKLRSMRHHAEDETGPAFSTRTDKRVTRIGRFLRMTRLDELPQLWNVLRGEMSLVGPRPERPEFVDGLCERYPYFGLRSHVKPGLTGWAQIRHGYVNHVDGFEEKLALDLYYMKYRSLTMDLLILWKTAKTVLLFHGV